MIGKSILHYKIIEKLGEGGMGVVYLAEDTRLERRVAIKFLPHHIASSSAERKRFETEAKAAAAFNHPNIATIHAIEETENDLFLVMEYIPGKHLKEYLRKYHDTSQLVTQQEAIDIAVQIAKGLQAAHDRGIVHRDIKSANIMSTPAGQVKIMDFGLAKFRGSVQVTQTGTTVGTTAYMSPEQAKGSDVDQRADIWSFGVVLYEMLTGRLPFEGDYDQAVIYNILNEQPGNIAEINNTVNNELADIVTKCLQKDPADRFQNMDEIIKELNSFLSKDDHSHKEIKSAKADRSGKIKKALAAAGILIIAAVAMIYFIPWKATDSVERIPIAVVDFINETSEPELNGLSGMLITALEQSRRLAVVTRSRMFDILKQMDKADVDKIDESLGRQICQKANIAVMAVAAIRKFGQLYTIDLKVIDPFKNEYLFTAKEEAQGQEGIPYMLDKLSEKTRVELNERATQVKENNRDVASVTTTNLEAYQYYFQGEQFISQMKFNEAIEQFHKAIALDSTFALAYYRLGYAYGWGLKNDQASKSLQKARALLNRIPQKERYLLRAEEAHIEEGWDAAITIMEEGVKIYPDDKEILYVYGDALYHVDRYAESINYLEKVLQMDPGHERALNHILLAFQAINSYDKAIDYGKQYIQQSHDFKAFTGLAHTYISAGKFDKALETYLKGLQIYPDNSALQGGIGSTYAYQGKYEASEAYFKLMTGKENPNSVRVNGYRGLTNLYALQGKYNLTMKMFDNQIELYQLGNDMHMVAEYGIFKAYMILLGRGKKEGVLQEVEKTLEIGNPGCDGYNSHLSLIYIDFEYLDNAYSVSEQYVSPQYHYVVKAREHFNNNEWAKAIAKYESEENYKRYPDIRYQIAQCYYELNKWQKAIEEIKGAQNLYSGIWWWMTYPKTFYLLGRIYEEKGDLNLAIENYEKFLNLWQEADPDLPDLIDAKEHLMKLKGVL